MYSMTTMDMLERTNITVWEVRFGQTHTHYVPYNDYEVTLDTPHSRYNLMLKVTDILQFGDYFFIRVVDAEGRPSIVESFKRQEQTWHINKYHRSEVTL